MVWPMGFSLKDVVAFLGLIPVQSCSTELIVGDLTLETNHHLTFVPVFVASSSF